MLFKTKYNVTVEKVRTQIYGPERKTSILKVEYNVGKV